MRVPIRKTAQGTEYWDNVEKRTVLIPTGIKPDFEVTENPKSMLQKDGDKDQSFGVHDGENNYQLNDMTIKELKEFAEKYTIDLPAELTKKGDIAKFIFDNWNPDAE